MARIWLSYLRAPWLTLALLVAITAAFGLRAAKVPVDSSLEALVVDDDPDRLFFDDFQRQFGTDEFLVAAVESHRVFTYASLVALQALTARLQEVDGVSDVSSLATAEDIVGSDEDFLVGPFLEEIPADQEALRELRIRAVNNPLYRGALISGDAKTAAIVIELEAGLSGRRHSETIEAIRQILRHYREGTTRLAGKPVMDHFSALFMQKDLQHFLPLTIALMAFILWLLLRNWFGATLPLFAMGICLVWAMGVLGLIGGTVNNITTILPPLIMALTVAVAIHLLTTYQDNLASARFAAGGEERDEAIHPADGHTAAQGIARWVQRLRSGSPSIARSAAAEDLSTWTRRLHGERFSLENNAYVVHQTLLQLWKPCLVASLTTVAGFASLTVSDVPPMRHFGIAAAIGVMFSFVIAFGFLPVAWLLVRRPVARRHDLLEQDAIDSTLVRMGTAIERQPRRVLLLTGLLAVVATLGALRLRVETNLLEYFEPGSEIVRDTTYVERHLAGVEDVRISLRAANFGGVLTVDNLRRMEALHDFLVGHPVVDKVTSVVDYLKEMNQSFHDEDRDYYRLPDSPELIAQYMLLYDGKDLHNFLDEARQAAAVYVRVHEHSSRRLRALITEIRQFLVAQFPSDIQCRVTGPTVLVSNLIDTLIRSQVSSLALASVVVFCMVTVLFRSLKIGALAMLPNLLPILLNLGLMGWAGIPLDTATAMISAVAIGIAVDDTVHFLAEYKNALASGADVPHAMRFALMTKGRAMIFTSILLTAAFGILLASNFLPTIHFGALSALTMISALLADLFFLPALLLVTRARP